MRAAVLPATGIGDALLMMIASHQLQAQGYEVTTFHAILPELHTWFPYHRLTPSSSAESLSDFDLIVAENDNSPRIATLRTTLRDKLAIFYPTYLAHKHGPLGSLDQVFDPQLPMAENIARAAANMLQCAYSKANGIQAPNHLMHRAHRNTIAIHPTSSQLDKNWLPKRYVTLAKALRTQGFSPFFCTSPQERSSWIWLEDEGFDVPLFPSLTALAERIYQAGFMVGNDSVTGHLASNLSIPSLIIANDARRMRLWRPGWLEGKVVTPADWIPNLKPLRLREAHWQKWISVRKVLTAFDELTRAF